MTHVVRPVGFDNLKTMAYEVTDRCRRCQNPLSADAGVGRPGGRPVGTFKHRDVTRGDHGRRASQV
jgi:hypothetical protein